VNFYRVSPELTPPRWGRELSRDLQLEIMPTDPWYKRVNVGVLDEEARRLILAMVERKLGLALAPWNAGVVRGSQQPPSLPLPIISLLIYKALKPWPCS